jgi:hypothetical protein
MLRDWEFDEEFENTRLCLAFNSLCRTFDTGFRAGRRLGPSAPFFNSHPAIISYGRARAAALPQLKKRREIASSSHLITYAWIAVLIFWILDSAFWVLKMESFDLELAAHTTFPI